VFEDRGKIKTKGKGEMQMYFVDWKYNPLLDDEVL
jgi:hypothetical protein